MESNIIKIIINGIEVEAKREWTILYAAHRAGTYIPSLCAHPDLPPLSSAHFSDEVWWKDEKIPSSGSLPDEQSIGCGLCLVKIEGKEGFYRSCATNIEDGMVIVTEDEDVKAKRRENFSKILARHPHACLTCAQKDGCSLTQCSSNVHEEERCCEKFGNCEIQKLTQWIAISEDTPRYVPGGDKQRVEEGGLINQRFYLCIGCGRCLRACNELRGVGALAMVWRQEEGRAIIGTRKKGGAEASGCRFCGACIEVCPTGALMDLYMPEGKREDSIVPCRASCPAGVDIPLYIRLIREGRFQDAINVVRQKVVVAEVLGYVCYHPCEDYCRRGRLNQPLAICDLKLFAASKDDRSWFKMREKPHPTGRKVAIVGSGPAGLSCAYYLAGKGHQVTVFEKMPRPGGMLRYGIPTYRLPEEVVDREIELIERSGVKIMTSSPIGEGEKSLTSLLDDGYDAVVIATGGGRGRDFKINGIEKIGGKKLWNWVDFLYMVNGEGKGAEFFKGAKVVVIGGGNIAIDVARCCIRLQCSSVKVITRRENTSEMPAFKDEIALAIQDGVEILNGLAPVSIADFHDEVEITFVNCKRIMNHGESYHYDYDYSQQKQIYASALVIATGQRPDTEFLKADKKVKLNEDGSVKVRKDDFMTERKGVFCAGDARGIAGSVVVAVADGRKVASSVDSYLGGDGVIDEFFFRKQKPKFFYGPIENFSSLERISSRIENTENRKKGFGVEKYVMNENEARREAKRCLECDYRLELSHVEIPEQEKRMQLDPEQIKNVPSAPGAYTIYSADGQVLKIKGVVDLRKALEEEAVKTTEARFFNYEEDPMYTKRETELLQAYMKEHAAMPPEGDEELDDLF